VEENDMAWQAVARWHIKEGKTEELLEAAEKIRKHWQEIALDVGLDPEKNVILEQDENEVRVAVSMEMDQYFSEGP
jgi:hypothetical protein